MRIKLGTLAVIALLLTGCGEPKELAELREQTEVACWEKHWPTVAENIATGFVGEEDGKARLARLCVDMGEEAVQKAKAK